VIGTDTYLIAISTIDSELSGRLVPRLYASLL